MSRFTQCLQVMVIAFILLACSQKPVFTVEVYKSPVPSPEPAAPTLTFTPPAAPLSLASPAAPGMPSDFTPVLYGKKYDANTFFLVLGGLQGEVWLAPDLAAVQFAHIPASPYDVYSFARNNFQVQGSPPAFSPPHKIYTVGTEATVDEVGMVAVARGWPVLQRVVAELDPNNEVYRQIVGDWLAAEGIAAPQLAALQIMRVDIEGDGVDEIFISATRLDGSQHMTRSGDYSVVLMRKVSGNDVATLPIVGNVYTSAEAELTYPRAYSLANFIDLNGDGMLEVVIDIQRWEGFGAVVYQIDGQSVIESLRAE